MTPPEPGTVWLGRYRLTRRLGTGGSATVWEAEDQLLGRLVAIKRLHMPTDDGSRRFMREARLGASLQHPGLVTVLDVVEGDETLQLVMELVDGGSLSDVLSTGPLPWRDALPLLRSVAAALDHAHAYGIVHRDVKPDNILIGRDGRPRLADLGIAQAVESTQLTAPGAVLGTPAFLAPEVLEGARATPAADVYALGAVAFETLSGRRARSARSSLELIRRIVDDPPPDLRQAWPEAPPGVPETVARAMCRNPEGRPASATAFVDELEAAFAAAGSTREHTKALPAAAAAAAGVAGAAAAHADEAEAAAPARPAHGDGSPGTVSDEPAPTGASRTAGRRPAAPGGRRTPSRTGATGAPAAVHRGGGGRGARRIAAVAAIGAVAAAIALVLLIGRDTEDPGGERAAATPTATSDGAAAADGTATPDATATPDGTATPQGDADPEDRATRRARRRAGEPGATPGSAVRGFYERAAAKDFDGAWALAGPSFRAAFGNSQTEFERQLSSLQSIEFEELAVSDRTDLSATVTVQTVATHTDRVDRCAGPLLTTRTKDSWVVDPGGVSCQSSPR